MAAVMATGLALSACAPTAGTATPAESGGTKAAEPVNVGIIYSKTGPLAAYGATYYEGLQAGIDHATGGTGAVNGAKINLTYADDGGDPDKAVTAAKDMIGQGYKIIGGTVAPASRSSWRNRPRRTRSCTSPDLPPPTPSRASTSTPSARAARACRTSPPPARSSTPTARRWSSSRRTTPSARATSPPSRPSSEPRAPPWRPSWSRTDRSSPRSPASSSTRSRTWSSWPGPGQRPAPCGRP